MKHRTSNEELEALLKEAIKAVYKCQAELRILQAHKWRLMRRTANRVNRNWEAGAKAAADKIK